MSEFETTVKRIIPAPRETVFEAWLDPKALARFMVPEPGMTVPRAETDPRVGGRYLIVMQAGEQEIPHQGEYKVIDRHDRLQFTWTSPYTTHDQLVTLTFVALSEGETELTLHHHGFDSEESRDNHEKGWGAILEALSRTVPG